MAQASAMHAHHDAKQKLQSRAVIGRQSSYSCASHSHLEQQQTQELLLDLNVFSRVSNIPLDACMKLSQIQAHVC